MTFTLASLTSLLALGVVICAVYILARGRSSARRRHPSNPLDWTPELSVDRYQPMFRLLEEDDFRFLRSQPGATPALVRRLRRHRYLLFRGYLRCLKQDFHGCCDMLMLVAVQSESDRRDILRALLVNRMKFAMAVIRVHWRLLLYRWNLARVPVGHLLGLFESLQLELLALDPAGVHARV